MQKFKFVITETLKKYIEIESESLKEAERIVDDMYRKCEIVLNADNFADVEIKNVLA